MNNEDERDSNQPCRSRCILHRSQSSSIENIIWVSRNTILQSKPDIITPARKKKQVFTVSAGTSKQSDWAISISRFSAINTFTILPVESVKKKQNKTKNASPSLKVYSEAIQLKAVDSISLKKKLKVRLPR